MGTIRPIKLNLTTGELELVAVPLLDQAEASVTPTASLLPRADGTGKLAADWIPQLGISQLPVASSGEVSATKVVRADDARLGNPTVGGDLSGTAASATVAKLRGRTVATTSPSNGQALVWNNSTSQWEPGTVSGGTGAVPTGGTLGQVLTKASSTDYDAGWADNAGGGDTPGSLLYLFQTYR